MTFGIDTKGVYAIAPTPFRPNGALDVNSVSRMTEFYFGEAQVDGLTILGIMGEAPKLEPEEATTIVQQTIAKADGKPVVVGVSAPGFAAMRRLSHEAMSAGAAGVMITPPGSVRTDDQISSYYRQAVAHIGNDIPFVLQDHPTVTGVIMSNTVVRRVIDENPSCVMLKHEDWPGLAKISTLRDWQAKGEMRPISIMCGNGGLFLDFEVERGADGAMTGYAFPEMLIDLVRLIADGNRDVAHDMFDAHLPLLRYEHQPVIGLAVRKYVLAKRGIISHPDLRGQEEALPDVAVAEVHYLLSRLSKVDRRASGLT